MISQFTITTSTIIIMTILYFLDVKKKRRKKIVFSFEELNLINYRHELNNKLNEEK